MVHLSDYDKKVLEGMTEKETSMIEIDKCVVGCDEYINRNDFGSLLLTKVQDKEYLDHLMETMMMGGHKHFREGFIQGLLWAYIETSNMDIVYIKKEDNKD